jgi:hypothetical protein
MDASGKAREVRMGRRTPDEAECQLCLINAMSNRGVCTLLCGVKC